MTLSKKKVQNKTNKTASEIQLQIKSSTKLFEGITIPINSVKNNTYK